MTERRGHAAVRSGLLNHEDRFVSKSTFSGEVSVFTGLLIVGEEATEEKQDSCGICGSFRQI